MAEWDTVPISPVEFMCILSMRQMQPPSHFCTSFTNPLSAGRSLCSTEVPKNIFFLLKLATNVLKKTPHTEHRAWEMTFR